MQIVGFSMRGHILLFRKVHIHIIGMGDMLYATLALCLFSSKILFILAVIYKYLCKLKLMSEDSKFFGNV